MYPPQALLDKLNEVIDKYLDDLKEAVEDGHVDKLKAASLRDIERPTFDMVKGLNKKSDLPKNTARAVQNVCCDEWPTDIVDMCRAVENPSEIVTDLLKGSKPVREVVVVDRLPKGKTRTRRVEKKVFVEVVDMLHLVLNQPGKPTYSSPSVERERPVKIEQPPKEDWSEGEETPIVEEEKD